MRRSQLASAAATLAILVGLSNGPAVAQTYSNVVTFGDSDSDNGNVFRQFPAGPPGGWFPYQPLTGGRFVNPGGRVMVEILASQIQPQTWATGSMIGAGTVVPIPSGANANFAFGGARADQNANLLLAAIPNVTQQINQYQAQGGVFGPNTLVTYRAGPNDILQAILFNPAATSATVAATASASAVVAGSTLQTLINRGATTILVQDVPNMGAFPQFLGTPLQPLATAGTNAFNQGLAAQTAAVAAANPGANLILLPVDRLYRAIDQNPARFGFTNTTAGCFFIPACSGNPAVQSTYVYWDTVHASSAMQALLAAFASEYLFYGRNGMPVAALAETSVTLRQQNIDATMARLAAFQVQPANASTPRGLEVSFSSDVRRTNWDARGAMPSVRVDAVGARLSIDGTFGPGIRAGVALGYSGSDGRAGGVTYNSSGVAADAFFTWRQGGFILDGVAGVSVDRFDDVERRTAIGGNSVGSTTGVAVSAAVRGGYAISFGHMTVVPYGGLSWIRTTVDGFTENSDLVAYRYAARDVSVLTGEAGLRVHMPIQNLMATLTLAYRGNLSWTGDPLTVSLPQNTARPMAMSIGKPGESVVRFGAALQGAVTEALTLSVEYDGEIGSGRNEHTGRVRAVLRF